MRMTVIRFTTSFGPLDVILIHCMCVHIKKKKYQVNDRYKQVNIVIHVTFAFINEMVLNLKVVLCVDAFP